MGVPNKFDRLGIITTNKLPSDYLAAEFLESTGTQYIISPIKPNNITGCHAVGSFAVPDIGAGLVCARGGGYNPRWYALYASGSGQILLAWENELSYFDEILPQKIYSTYLNYKNNRKIEFNGQTVDITSTYTGSADLCFFCFQSDQFRICPGRLFRVVLTQDKQETANYVAAVNPTGEPVLFDILTNTVLKKSSTEDFVVGFTRAQARKLAELPSTGGTLTVSLPWEAQWDTGVQNALDIAATKGWTITVQYRDPEIATTNIPASFLEFNQGINTPYNVQDFLAPKELYIDANIQRTDPNGGMWLSLIGYNAGEQYIQRISIAGFDYNAKQHNDWACQWVAPNNRGGFKYQGQVDFSRRNKVLYRNTTVDINGIKTESPLNGTGNHGGGAIIFINQPSGYAIMQLYRASYAENSIKIFDYVPCITSTGQAVLYNRIDNSEVSVTYSSIGLTIAQAYNLSKLPVTESGTLTVSLPWEAQWDAGVQAALQVATGRGWTITVQYRDPEVTTTNIPVSFLESTGTQYVMTDYVPTIDFGAKVIFSQEEPDTQTRAVGGVFRPYFVLPRYYSGSRIVGGWGQSGAIYLTNRPYVSGKHTSSLNYKNSRLLEFDDTDKYSFTAEWADGDGILSLFAYNGGGNMQFIGGMRIYDAVFTMQDSVIGHYIPVLDTQGTPCMYDCSTKQLFPNSGTGSFVVGFETTDKAALGLSKLPIVQTGELTVSLPAAAQDTTTFVPAAIEVARQRGWTIITQYRED